MRTNAAAQTAGKPHEVFQRLTQPAPTRRTTTATTAAAPRSGVPHVPSAPHTPLKDGRSQDVHMKDAGALQDAYMKDSGTLQDAYMKARELERTGKYVEAEREYLKALAERILSDPPRSRTPSRPTSLTRCTLRQLRRTRCGQLTTSTAIPLATAFFLRSPCAGVVASAPADPLVCFAMHPTSRCRSARSTR